MKHFVFSVKDLKSGFFNQPGTYTHEAIAHRDFASAVRNPESIYHTYPDDFALHCIAVFDNDTGEFVDARSMFEPILARSILSEIQ